MQCIHLHSQSTLSVAVCGGFLLLSLFFVAVPQGNSLCGSIKHSSGTCFVLKDRREVDLDADQCLSSSAVFDQRWRY